MLKRADVQCVCYHCRAKADVSSTVIPKGGPNDKLCNLVLIDGKLSIIEYSDLPDDLANRRDAEGNLWIAVGNPAIHIFRLEFLQRVTEDAVKTLPFHLARKKVPHWDPERGAVEPTQEN